jgi:hypothetical protein
LRTAPGGSLVGPGHGSQWVRGPDGKDYLPYRVQLRSDYGHAAPQLLALDAVWFDGEGWPRVGNGHPSERAKAVP